MAAYTVKLVNHTRATQRLLDAIKTNIQELFNQVFSGTSDRAAVDWGAGSNSDSVVLHFVDDIASSYVQQKMPGKDIRADAGGHTRTRGHVTGSEFYMHTGTGQNRRANHDRAYARLAFHESLHNQFPGWSNEDLHGEKGGGGLALSPPQEPMTDKNKELMRRGLSIRNAQLP